MGGLKVNELVIEKRHNEVMDLSIAYGLLHILNFNEIKASLHNYKGAFVIRHEDFNPNNMFLFQQEEFDFGKFLNRGNQKKLVKKVFDDPVEDTRSELLNEGIFESIINYYSSDVNKREEQKFPNKIEKLTDVTIIGSWYGGKGQRSKSAHSVGYRTMKFERWLAELGFVTTASFLSIDGDDFLIWLAQPSEKGTKENRRFEQSYVDKETGEIKKLRFIRADNVESVIAEQLLNIQEKATSDNLLDEYDGVLFLQGWNNGNTGSPDKVRSLDWYPFSDNTLTQTKQFLQPYLNDKKIELRYQLAKWLLTRTKQSFYELVQVLAKDARKININNRKDYLYMAKLEKLHTNKGVAVIGKRLNGLLYDKKGYGVLVDFMDVHSKSELMNVVSKMSVIHNKATKGQFNIWNDEEYASFLKVVNDERFKAKDISSAILLHSQTYPAKRTKEEDKIETEEIGTI